MLELNLDDFCRIFAQVGSSELADELLHDEAALVLDEERPNSFLLIPAQLVRQPQHLAHRLLDGRAQVVIRRHHEKWLPWTLEAELLERLVEELQQHKHAVRVDEQLRQVDELVDAIRLEVLEHVNEQVGDDHRRDDAVPVVLVPVVVHLEDVVIGEGLLALLWLLGQRLFQSGMIEDRLEAVELRLFRQEKLDAATVAAPRAPWPKEALKRPEGSPKWANHVQMKRKRWTQNGLTHELEEHKRT